MATIRVRRGTAAELATIVLASGELGWTTDTNRFYVGDGVTYGGICVQEERAAAEYGVPLMLCRSHTCIALTNAQVANTFQIIQGGYTTGGIVLKGFITTAATTKTDRLQFEGILPPEYVPGGAITLRIRARYVEVGTIGAKTVDAKGWLMDDDGAPAGDKVATAIQTLTAAFANYDFTVTPTGLAAGDRLNMFVETVIQDTGAGGSFAEISRISFLLATRG